MNDPGEHEPVADTAIILPPGFLQNPVHFLAFGLGSGAMARAPGTWGSLAAIPLYYLFFWLPVWGYWGLVLAAFLVGIWLCGKTADDLKVHDHGGIVWDEFVGMWIVLGYHPETFFGVLAAFLLFRFFDVLKPWPISWCDKRMPGGLGIMFDDVLAGLMAIAGLAVLDLWLFPGFF